MARMIFVCSQCNSTYGANSGTHNLCPECKVPLIETNLTCDYWHSLSDSQKERELPKLLQRGYAKHAKFCSHCGKEILSEAIVCPSCGCNTSKNDVDQSISVGWVILSLLFPLVGGIYFFASRKTRPNSAKICAFLALISWFTGLSGYIGGFIFGFLGVYLGLL